MLTRTSWQWADSMWLLGGRIAFNSSICWQARELAPYERDIGPYHVVLSVLVHAYADVVLTFNRSDAGDMEVGTHHQNKFKMDGLRQSSPTKEMVCRFFHDSGFPVPYPYVDCICRTKIVSQCHGSNFSLLSIHVSGFS